jgi:hypothetical protein
LVYLSVAIVLLKPNAVGVTTLNPALVVMKTDLEETQTIVPNGSLVIVVSFAKKPTVTVMAALALTLVVSVNPLETVKLVTQKDH